MSGDPSKSNSSREAVVAQYNERPVGVCIYLGPSELNTLDIDPSQHSVLTYELQPAQSSIKLKTRDAPQLNR